MNLTIEDISLIPLQEKEGLHNIFLKNQPFVLTLNNGFIPFGIEKVYYKSEKKYIIKIEINKSMSDFFSFFEDLIGRYLNLDKNKLKSQIIKSKRNFNDKLIAKIKTINDKFQLQCYKNNKEISVFEIVKEKDLTISLVPFIYYNESVYIIKWIVDKINILCV